MRRYEVAIIPSTNRGPSTYTIYATAWLRSDGNQLRQQSVRAFPRPERTSASLEALHALLFRDGRQTMRTRASISIGRMRRTPRLILLGMETTGTCMQFRSGDEMRALNAQVEQLLAIGLGGPGKVD
jgi:hypothetical protein